MADKRKEFVQELLDNHLIEQNTADQILAFYKAQSDKQPNKLLIIFGGLGALLVGLGILLLIASNWNDFPDFLKTFFAFLPLLVGQSLGYHTLKHKPDSALWRETSAIFTSVSVASAIAMIHQIYNLPESSFANFLLVWMLLILPLVYLLQSNATAILYIAGTTYFGYESSYMHESELKWLFWPMLMAVAPYYYQVAQKVKQSTFISFCHLLFLASVTTLYPSLFSKNFSPTLIGAGFACLGAFYYVIGKSNVLEKMNQEKLSFISVGTLIILCTGIMFSFEFVYEERHHSDLFVSSFISILPLILAAGIVFKEKMKIPVFALTGLALLIIAFIGLESPGLGIILANILVLAAGIYQISQGMKNQNLQELNLGLIYVSVLILARFFDTNIDFVVRGLVFIALGCMFFAINYKMIQSRKNDQ